MTPASKDFVSLLPYPLYLKVQFTFFNQARRKWNNHVELGLWADIIIIAWLQ
jgi:phosphopantothenoylcysteine decarboxylase/phosphopantothenate--cysteine ligase